MNAPVPDNPQTAALFWNWATSEPISEAEWQRRAVEWLREDRAAALVALVANDRGTWRATALAGEAATLPYDLLGDALEAEQSLQRNNWWASPLGRNGELLVVSSDNDWDAGAAEAWECDAALLERVLRHLRGDARALRRIDRLQRVLEIAARWQIAQDIDELLERMAVTSTQLLEAERASIFLWDRKRKELVAHPALGVEGESLRIPDDTGVVGDVVHSGEPRRTDPAETEQVDRRVDIQLNFHTRSLLCVPLRDRRDHVIGAFEVINKNGLEGRFNDEDEETLIELARHAALALDQTRAFQRILQARNRLVDELSDSTKLIGSSPAICSLRETLTRMAEVDLNVLVLGESGTGKEVVARMLHYGGSRRDGPFVAVNCGALSANLIESELFGHEKGAFTGADSRKTGKFEQASGGTLFLDEIGEMSDAGQVKLLRVLEQRVITRVGGNDEIPVDVRLVAATNRDLAERVNEGKFRNDLYYRLSVMPITLPPLRERGNDILQLAEYFLAEFAEKRGKPTQTLTESAKELLLRHAWPGNVRELRNVMERLAYTLEQERIEATDIDWDLKLGTRTAPGMDLSLPLTEATREFQVDYIQRQIAAAEGRMTEVARRLGLHRSNLYRKMKQLGMSEEV